MMLSLEDVPSEVFERLRERASLHNRSVESETLAILEAAVFPGRLSASELLAEIRGLGIKTPSESVAMIREDRDSDDR